MLAAIKQIYPLTVFYSILLVLSQLSYTSDYFDFEMTGESLFISADSTCIDEQTGL